MAVNIEEIHATKIAHGLTLRTYEGVHLRVLRHDHYAPRGRAPFSEEQVELLVIVRDSWRSCCNAAVDIVIVYDIRDFTAAEIETVRDAIGRQFSTTVIDQESRCNPHKRGLTFTLWKNCCEYAPRLDWLLHVLDVNVPLTWAIRRNWQWREIATNGSRRVDRAAM